MQVIVDANAGPCSGVKRALRLIEAQLAQDEEILALGSIIHNKAEMERLAGMGLTTIDQAVVEEGGLDRLRDKKVFVRSHGIGKKLDQQVRDTALAVCDGTCPNVRAIQKTIERYHQRGYQILIVGTPGHAEVVGLSGHCDDQAIVIQSPEEVAALPFAEKRLLVAQTTVARNKFLAIQEKILQIAPHTLVQDTTCRQVSNRHANMRNFAASVDVLLLVGGKNSSNTRVLFEIAKQRNPRTFWIEAATDIERDWLIADSIGITGSASTPLWQLQKIKEYVESIT
ncbi:4-hydroxy-3-methylbut-2-enyl diphosphate reductase [candidate division KSB1 bacterium]|nr:4-hydroxy-3-methylbut-2-enyl diphosphate reductase [candidate division KSB1 bacterium]RQW09457.1 MAG: 4-hydroxy-3-methylbut-2-enyl diphosphate reductase [candidate division KSB1 bacterium]